MIIKRKCFVYPSSTEIEEYVEIGFFSSKKVKITRNKPYSYKEIVDQTLDFINNLKQDNIINICEYTADQGSHNNYYFVIYYWEEEQKDTILNHE